MKPERQKLVFFFHKAGLMAFKTLNSMLGGNTMAYSTFGIGLRSSSSSNLIISVDLVKLQPKMQRKSLAA